MARREHPGSPTARAFYRNRVGRQHFKRIRQIGYGAVGKVFIVKPVGIKGVTGYFAMKRMKKVDIEKRKKVTRVLTERHVLKTANHPFICTMYYSFQTKTKLYYIMQFCAGGEFFRMLKFRPKRRLEESQAKFYAAEILLALEYIHLIGFYYRDLKPENILIHKTGHVMLTDFDLSKAQSSELKPSIRKVVWKGKKKKRSMRDLFSGKKTRDMIDTDSNISIERTTSMLGTVEYMCRDMVSGKGYGSSADWWSFGVLVYEMLYGNTPFKGTNWEATLQNIRKDVDIKLPTEPAVSKHCAQLIRNILSSSKSRDRLDNAIKIKQHKWFRGLNFQLIRNQTPPIVPETDDDLDFKYFYRKKREESDLSEEEGIDVTLDADIDFEDGFDGFDWARGSADPHWTLDPTIEGSPASKLMKAATSSMTSLDLGEPAMSDCKEAETRGGARMSSGAEKFCKWDDKSTGINPFRDVRPPKISMCIRVLSNILGCFLALFRIPLFYVFVALLLLTNAVLSRVPGRILRRPLVRVNDALFARLALLVLGFVYVPSSYADLRRLRIMAASNRIRKSVYFGWGVSRGQVLLCNFSSFVQILFLAASFSPNFVAIVPGTDDAVVLSLFEALTYMSGSITTIAHAKNKRCLPLNVLLKSGTCDGPLIIFPEGRARTNNLGVLRFDPVFGKDEDENDGRAESLVKRLHFVAFKFPKQQGFSPAQPTRGMLYVVSRLCMQLAPAKMELSSLCAKHVPALSDPDGDKGSPSRMLEVSRDLLSKMINAKAVDLGAREYAEFLSYARSLR
eukprot:g3333.t1